MERLDVRVPIPTGKKRIKGEVLDIADLYAKAAAGAMLLAPNLRSARSLRLGIEAYRQERSGSGSLSTPLGEQVLHWRGWTSTLWQAALLNGSEDRVLLQPLQERLLWESVLDAEGLIYRTEALTDLCLSASNRVLQHGAQDAVLLHARSSGEDDTVRFARWFREVQQRCERERLLQPAALEGTLGEHLQRRTIRQTEAIVGCSLDALAPAQYMLLQSAEAAGVPILRAPESMTPGAEASRVLLRCADDSDEWRALAGFLKQALHREARPSITVIVPDLSQARESIDRSLREHLWTGQEDPFREERQPLWEFSTARPLAATAIAADALRLLQWTVRELEAGEVSSLLRSPYLAWPVSPEYAAELDTSLLRRGNRVRPTWAPRATAFQLAKASKVLGDVLMQRTEDWRRLAGSATSHSAHVERCRRILRDFGWPGERTRTSEEFQAVQRWQAVLDSLSALDVVAARVSWESFLDRLAEVVRSTPFARENTGAPVQFVTPEESTGTTADAVWVAHADESRWSSHAAPHPLLPWTLQVQHAMPGVDAPRDQAAFTEQLHRIAGMAPTVTFSYAHVGAAGEQRPCALVEQLPAIQREDAAEAAVLETVAAEGALEEFQDGDLIPLVLDGAPVAGGVSVLKSQAACAFRAFAERRLGASTLDSHDLGLDARDRGNVLHQALHIFWQQTGNRRALLDLMGNGRLEAAVHHAVTQALHPHHEANDRWALHYQSIERERLESLLLRWLQYESKRSDFTVESMEEDIEVTMGSLPLKVRVDRVDRVTAADGTEYRVIIDYKTGELNHKKWEGDRPDEPQLPLYAATTGAQEDGIPVGAIAFGIVRAGEKLQFQSLPRKSALLGVDDRATPDVLGAELESWKHTLEALAQDFAAGIASVGPKQYPSTCKFCDQRLLCRLNPELLHLDEEEGEAEA